MSTGGLVRTALQRGVRRGLLVLLAGWIVAIVVPSQAQAEWIPAAERSAVARSDRASSLPSNQPYLTGTDRCEVQLNPAFWQRADVMAAVEEAHRIARQSLSASTKSEQSKASATSPPSPVAVRTDAAGHVVLRVGFVATAGELRVHTLAQLEVAARQALTAMGDIFQGSGVPAAFELAGVQAYTGDARESAAGDSQRTLWNRLTSTWTAGSTNPDAVPGNYSATLAHQKQMKANILVLLVPPNLNEGAGGMAFIGSGRYGGSPWMLMATATYVAAGYEIDPRVMTHEVGHVMGQRHGIETDYVADEREYRLTVNHPFAMGFRSPQPYGGISTMMAYTSPSETPVPRFSDPNATSALGSQHFVLGKADRADSVRALNVDLRSFALGTIPDLEPWPVEVVEYYHAGLNQYYMTAAPENIASLDRLGPAATGWTRTGQTIKAISAWGELPIMGAAWLQPPLERGEIDRFYRFYGSPEGLNTHFYGGTSDSRGIAGWGCTAATYHPDTPPDSVETLRALQADHPGDPMILHFEGIDFRGPLMRYECDIPSLAIKRFVPTCDASYRGTGVTLGTPVFRLYNNEQGTRTRADGSRIQGNHRYSKDLQIRDAMLAQGWVDEGIAWCEPRIVGTVSQ